ncbi:MAG: HNH endonuclease, partial [Candidatus Woesearchaeota archaeon]
DNRKELRPNKDRTCRFCGKSYPEVKFKNVSHLIPELMGNEYYLSDFECDSCNSKFGVYENDLAYFFGSFLAVSGIMGKTKVPKFKSNDRHIVIHQNPPYLDIEFNDAEYFKQNIGYDRKNDIQRINYYKNPFTPLNVYKSFLKIALSRIHESDLPNLKETIKFLNGENEYGELEKNSFFTIHKFFIPGNFNNEPIVLSFKKKQEFEKYPAPTHLFIIQIRNIIYQIFIPFHKSDMFFFEPKQERKFFIVPPFVPESWTKQFGGPFSEYVNLGSNIRTKGQKGGIEYKY